MLPFLSAVSIDNADNCLCLTVVEFMKMENETVGCWTQIPRLFEKLPDALSTRSKWSPTGKSASQLCLSAAQRMQWRAASTYLKYSRLEVVLLWEMGQYIASSVSTLSVKKEAVLPSSKAPQKTRKGKKNGSFACSCVRLISSLHKSVSMCCVRIGS